MRPRTWLLATLSSIVGISLLLAGFNMAMDLYGLFRPVRGRRLVAYGDPRVAKYLFSARYVPQNFDAILVGPSVSANWDLTAIEQMRVYNNSLDAANIIEQRAMARAALGAPGLTAVFMIVHPALTASHDYKTVNLSPALKRSALGSLSLWDAYKDIVNIRLHRSAQVFDYAGTEHWSYMPAELNANMKRMYTPGPAFEIDADAWREFRGFLAEIRARRARLFFIVPPIFEDLLASKREAFAAYARMVRAETAPEDRWIDFTTEEFADFRKTRANFGDGVHIVPAAARRVVAHLDRQVKEWMREEGTTLAVRRPRVQQ